MCHPVVGWQQRCKDGEGVEWGMTGELAGENVKCGSPWLKTDHLPSWVSLMSGRLILFSADFVVMGAHTHAQRLTHTHSQLCRIQLTETSKRLQFKLVAGRHKFNFPRESNLCMKHQLIELLLYCYFRLKRGPKFWSTARQRLAFILMSENNYSYGWKFVLDPGNSSWARTFGIKIGICHLNNKTWQINELPNPTCWKLFRKLKLMLGFIFTAGWLSRKSSSPRTAINHAPNITGSLLFTSLDYEWFTGNIQLFNIDEKCENTVDHNNNIAPEKLQEHA